MVKNTSSRRRSARIQKSKKTTPEPEVETIEEEKQGNFPHVSLRRLSRFEIVDFTNQISEETVEEEPLAEVEPEEEAVEVVDGPSSFSKIFTAFTNNIHTIVRIDFD